MPDRQIFPALDPMVVGRGSMGSRIMAATLPDRRPSPSGGGMNLVAIVLLSCCLLAVGVLIGILVMQGGTGPVNPPPKPSPTGSPGPVVADGQKVERGEKSPPPKSPPPMDDPARIKETLREGKTYSVVLKAGLDARAEDKAWWRKEVVHLAYVAEMQIDRSIESNDGRRVVELRRFVVSRNAKLLCDVEDVSIDLGAPGALVLGALSYLQPGAALAATLAKPVAESILREGSQEVARSETAKAFAHVDSLSGKAVRIAYVDGVGVESITPVGCSLDAEEQDFIFNTAILSDCYVWDLKKAVGDRWEVDGAQLAGFIDPSLRGVTEGSIKFIRDADGRDGGRPFAALRIEGGTLRVDSSDASRRRIGSFTPEGTLRFSLADKVVERATLTGRFAIDEVSTDHILFETSFKSRPTLKLEYSCEVR